MLDLTYIKIHFHVLLSQSIFFNRSTVGKISVCPMVIFTRENTYAMGLFRVHLFQEGSPYARIFLLSPSKSRHLESSLMRSTARLKCRVLLSGANTSLYRNVKTPPYKITHSLANCSKRPRFMYPPSQQSGGSLPS